LYVGLAVLVLWLKGFPSGIGTVGDGPFHLDWSGHIWSFWQASEWLAGREGLLSTDLILHPHGTNMALIHGDLLTTRIAGLIWLVAGGNLGWPLFAVLLLAGNGVGGTLLVGTVTGSRVAGYLAGLLLFFSGFAAWAVNSGNVEYAFWLWTCLFLAWFVRVLRRPSLRDAILTGVFGATAVLCNFVDGFHLPLLAGCLLAGRIRQLDRTHLVALTMAVGVAAVLVAPIAIPVIQEQGGTQAQEKDGTAEKQAKTTIAPHEIELPPLVTPSGEPPEPRNLEEYLPCLSVHRPWACTFLLLQLALVVAGFSSAPRRALPWLGVVGLFSVLAIGPHVSWFDRAVAAGFTTPFAWLQAHVPYYDRVHYPIRLNSYVLLAWIVLVGFGMRRLVAGSKVRLRQLVSCGIVVLAIPALAAGWKVRVTQAVEVSPFYQELGQTRDQAAIIGVPFTFYLSDSAHLYDQVHHGKPIFNGCILQHVPEDPSHGLVASNDLLAEIDRLQRDILEACHSVTHGNISRGPRSADPDYDAAREELAELGFEYLVLRTNTPVFHGFMRVRSDSDLTRFLHAVMGDPIYRDDQLTVFEMNRDRAATAALSE